MRIWYQKRSVWILAVVALGVAVVSWVWWRTLHVPGASFRGALPALTKGELELAGELRRTVEHLAGTIGERNLRHPERLEAAARFIEAELRGAGYAPELQTFDVEGLACHNVIAELQGNALATEVVVVGAHYDSALGSPAANDNGSGVAALLALARRFAQKRFSRTLRFVAFTNEEMPHFLTPSMGSFHFAERAKAQGENVVAMLSLETMGYYSDAPGSQKYPAGLAAAYPDTGNFIAFVADASSRELLHSAISTFRAHTAFPSEGAALPRRLPGVAWSDHAAFWQHGYPALMITDTAPFRYPHYHTQDDTPDKLDYERLARVTLGLEHVVQALVDERR